MATWTVYRKGTKIVFDSPYSNEEALKIADELENSFAADLVRKAKKFGLSDKQWAWIHRLVWEKDHPEAKVEKKVVTTTVCGILELFETAHANLKYPKLLFSIEGQDVKIQRAGAKSKHKGCLNLTDGKAYGENKWFGRINTDGSITVSGLMTDAILALLLALDKAPAETIEKYGKATGNCVCCGLPLTNSAVIGYGEKCAANWNLPYDKTLVKIHAAHLKSDVDSGEMVDEPDWTKAKKATVETVVTESAHSTVGVEDNGVPF